MALEREIARLAKILVDAQGISFDDAQTRLRVMSLEILVGPDAISPAAHAAVLTAVSVGRRSFIGGVSVRGALDQPLNSDLLPMTSTLGDACQELGAAPYDGVPSQRITVGTFATEPVSPGITCWWDGWTAGVRSLACATGADDNPLTGAVAGALAVGAAFDRERGLAVTKLPEDVDLWGVAAPPAFSDCFLPAALWIVGLGNLGQAFLWAIAALPYRDRAVVKLVLQDFDRVTEENWSTSILVRDEVYHVLKTKVAEAWMEARGFDVRRVDRRLLPSDRLDEGDPVLALSGLDRYAPRRSLSAVGFDVVIDAGLGGPSTTLTGSALRCSIVHAPSMRTLKAGRMQRPCPCPLAKHTTGSRRTSEGAARSRSGGRASPPRT